MHRSIDLCSQAACQLAKIFVPIVNVSSCKFWIEPSLSRSRLSNWNILLYIFRTKFHVISEPGHMKSLKLKILSLSSAVGGRGNRFNDIFTRVSMSKRKFHDSRWWDLLPRRQFVHTRFATLRAWKIVREKRIFEISFMMFFRLEFRDSFVINILIKSSWCSESKHMKVIHHVQAHTQNHRWVLEFFSHSTTMMMFSLPTSFSLLSRDFKIDFFVYSIACALIIHSCVANLNSNSVSARATWNSLKIVYSFSIYFFTLNISFCAICVTSPKKKATIVISMDQHISGVRVTPSVAVRHRTRHHIPVHWRQIIRTWALSMNAKAFHSSKIISRHRHLIVLRFQSHSHHNQRLSLRLSDQRQFNLLHRKLHKQCKKKAFLSCARETNTRVVLMCFWRVCSLDKFVIKFIFIHLRRCSIWISVEQSWVVWVAKRHIYPKSIYPCSIL